MTIDYKKKYLKYKSKYLQYKLNKTNKFTGGASDIELTIDKILDNNKIDSDTFKTILDKSDKSNLLVIIYAHWCSHCVSFIKENAKKLVEHPQSVNIKFLDGTQLSTEISNILKINGFPTILKIDNKSTSTNIVKKEYIGDRTVNSLINFLEQE